MLYFRSILRQMRIGIAVTLLILAGATAFVWIWGPLYGVWGWPEIVLGSLILVASIMAGIEMSVRQPNPYSRTYALYNLQDVSPDRNLQSGGTGWMIQAVPLVVTALLLIVFFLIT